MKRTFCAAIVAVWCVISASHALAIDCETDANCPDGMVCEVVGGVSVACPPGEDCPGESKDIYGCVPAPCDTDTDCGGKLVCIEVQLPCADTAVSTRVDCPAGEDCSEEEPAAEAEPCEPTSVGLCGPKWAAPCASDGDCGDGFTCTPVVEEDCAAGGRSDGSSGKAPAPTPDPDGDDESEPDGDGDESGEGEGGAPARPVSPEEPDCETVETGLNYCKPQTIGCESDEDCPSGWDCEKENVTIAVPDCPPDIPDCGNGAEPAPEADESGQCIPDGWYTWDVDGGSHWGGDEDSLNTGEPKGPEDPSPEVISGSGSKGPLGCGGGPSHVPPLGWLFIILVLGFSYRRKAHTA
jgi:hypothetical protein